MLPVVQAFVLVKQSVRRETFPKENEEYRYCGSEVYYNTQLSRLPITFSNFQEIFPTKR